MIRGCMNVSYISCAEAARALGISERRIQQLCKNNEIPGAVKQGKSWVIPEEYLGVSRSEAAVKANAKKPLPIGISDYKEAVSDYYYVDKTLLIKEFLDSRPKVSLFTRPRRFGKTLNMDMLRVFFEKTQTDSSKYFHDKAIWSVGDSYTAHQGKYPVIFMSFKDVKCDSWDETFQVISRLISLEYRRHIELDHSDRLSEYEKAQYQRLAAGTADSTEYQMSLQILSLLLCKHYGMEAIIIIDEYDTPIQQGHSSGFYKDVTRFMRNFFSGGLKDNPYLAYGFLTGILRVAKESIFSGLNNLKIYSILDKPYSEFFGFTKLEIMQMLTYYVCEQKYSEVCDWYDGYLFGEQEIFNPWSVINYVAENCFPKAFWQSTGSNDIIGEIIESANDEIIENLYRLLNGETVNSYIDTDVIYPEIHNNPNSIYSFLLVAGYLKIAKAYPQHDGNFLCDVAIPNREITFVYEKEILAKTGRASSAGLIQQAILSGDSARLRKQLEAFLLQSISGFDGSSESFYHGMMLGLCAALSGQYRIKSNGESGYGRFDLMLIPKRRANPGFIFEFKHTKDVHEDLKQLAADALTQIENKRYEAELTDLGVSHIVKIGIAFRGKKAEVCGSKEA